MVQRNAVSIPLHPTHTSHLYGSEKCCFHPTSPHTHIPLVWFREMLFPSHFTPHTHPTCMVQRNAVSIPLHPTHTSHLYGSEKCCFHPPSPHTHIPLVWFREMLFPSPFTPHTHP